MKQKDFKGYKRREIRISDEVWELLKAAKIKRGLKWNLFLKELLNKNAKDINNTNT